MVVYISRKKIEGLYALLYHRRTFGIAQERTDETKLPQSNHQVFNNYSTIAINDYRRNSSRG